MDHKIKIASCILSAFLSFLTLEISHAYPTAKKDLTNAIQQKIAVPSYFDPCTSGSNCGWVQLDKAIPKVGIALINPDSGPGSSIDSSYVTQTKTTHNLGASVLGYVYTNYGSRSLSAVEADVDKYYTWYNVDGIFFDEVYSNDCGKLSYYTALNQYVKAKGGQGITIINPGTNTEACYTAAADILVIFEDTYSSYQKWSPSSWVSTYPASKFWQIIYGASQSELSNALKLSSTRNAGWIYVTSESLPNPYGSMPASSYWATEVDWASLGLTSIQ